MSTYIYLTCECHNPRLVATEESGQHAADDLQRIRQWVADIRYGVRDFTGVDGVGSYFFSNTLSFVLEHLDCVLGLQDELGGLWSLELDGPTERIGWVGDEKNAIASYTEGDVQHNVNPVIGMLRRLEDAGEALNVKDMEWVIDRLGKATAAEQAWLEADKS